jgi:hypothetical protein
MTKYKVLWHREANYICVVDDTNVPINGHPILHVVSDEGQPIEAFPTYPIDWLIRYFGFTDIGEI